MSANTPPTFGPPECLHSYASDLSTYFELQLSSDQFFTAFEQSQMYLDGLKTNAKYRATATTLLRRLQEKPHPRPSTPTHPPPQRYPRICHGRTLPLNSASCPRHHSHHPCSPDLPSEWLQQVRSFSRHSWFQSSPSTTPDVQELPVYKACGSHSHEPTDCNLLPPCHKLPRVSRQPSDTVQRRRPPIPSQKHPPEVRPERKEN